jgi:hypothetical protein
MTAGSWNAGVTADGRATLRLRDLSCEQRAQFPAGLQVGPGRRAGHRDRRADESRRLNLGDV